MVYRIETLALTLFAWIAGLILVAINIPSFGENGKEEGDVYWTLIPGPNNQNQSLPQIVTECNGPGLGELRGHSYELFVGAWIMLGLSLTSVFTYIILVLIFSCIAISRPPYWKSLELGVWWSPVAYSLPGLVLSTLCFGLAAGIYYQYSLADIAASMCLVSFENYDISSRITTDWYTPSLLLLEIVQTRFYWILMILGLPMILHFFTGLIPCIYKEFHKDIKQWWREGQRRHRRGAYKRIRPVVMNPHEVDPQSEDSVIEIHEPRRQLPCQDQLFDIFKEKGIVSIIEGYAVNTKTHFTLAPLYDSNSDTYFA